jgi:hypothetical protein
MSKTGFLESLEDNEYLKKDLIRLSYTYAMFAFVALILVKFQALEYAHVFVITLVYMLATFVVELGWLFGLGDYRTVFKSASGTSSSDAGATAVDTPNNASYILYEDVDDNDWATDYKQVPTARTSFHELLNNVLPFTVLIFGYVILLDAFRSQGFASEGQHIEFYIRGVAGVVFVIGLGYLFYNLMDQMYGKHGDGDNAKRRSLGGWLYSRFDPDNSDMNSNASDTCTGGLYGTSTDADQWHRNLCVPTNASYATDDKVLPTHQDLILDILYNLFQPISIMVVAIIMYFLIRTVGYGGGGP